MAKLFITQERLDAWTAEQKISVAGDLLTLAADGRSFRIRPAMRFMRVAGGDADPHELLDTVQDDQDLERLGADAYMSSCIAGETAYDVQPGFLGEPVTGGPSPR